MNLINREWISVKDKLPKNNGYYLCWNRKSKCGNKEYWGISLLYWEDNLWLLRHNAFNTADCVTHWQPLPEPPKDEYRNISDMEECKQKVEQLNNLGVEVTPTELNIVKKVLARTARAIRDNTSEEHRKIQRNFAIDTLAGKRNRDVFL